MNGMDLFSGIGGMSAALSEWVRPVAYCEIDSYCQAVLLSRMGDSSILPAPIWPDIRSFPAKSFPQGYVDIIYGGFPCQDVSIAGSKKGLDGERSTLIFDMLRVANEIRPQFIFIENVPQIINLGACEIIKEINKMGMDCRWACLSAASCGAPHKRDRWFLLAYNNSKSSSKTYQASKLEPQIGNAWLRYSGLIGRAGPLSYWQEVQRPVFGMDDGVPNELDRAKALGNSVVSMQAKKAFKILMGL